MFTLISKNGLTLYTFQVSKDRVLIAKLHRPTEQRLRCTRVSKEEARKCWKALIALKGYVRIDYTPKSEVMRREAEEQKKRWIAKGYSVSDIYRDGYFKDGQE